MDQQTRAIRQMYRTSLSSFIDLAFRLRYPQRTFKPHWTINALGDALERCERGETTRLIINLPPRYLKSFAASVAFPAWLLGRRPEARVMCIAGNPGLAEEHHQHTCTLMAHPKYRAVFPHVQLTERDRALLLPHGGSCSRFTPSGGITGRGADFVIIDDPLAASAANDANLRESLNNWYDQNIYQRLDNKSKGVIIVVMQRLHVDDLTGHVMNQDGWTLLKLPVIADEDEVMGDSIVRRKGEALHEDLESLPQLREAMLNMGAKAFMAQYQQDPYLEGEGEGRSGCYSKLREGVRWQPEDGEDLTWFGSVTEEQILLHTIFGEGEHPWPDNMRKRMKLDEWEEFCRWSNEKHRTTTSQTVPEGLP